MGEGSLIPGRPHRGPARPTWPDRRSPAADDTWRSTLPRVSDDELTTAEAATRIAAVRDRLNPNRADLFRDDAATITGARTGLDVALAILARVPEARAVLGEELDETNLADILEFRRPGADPRRH